MANVHACPVSLLTLLHLLLLHTPLVPTHTHRSNTYSVLNALAGHYNSFGATAPIPKKRLDRINKVGHEFVIGGVCAACVSDRVAERTRWEWGTSGQVS